MQTARPFRMHFVFSEADQIDEYLPKNGLGGRSAKDSRKQRMSNEK